MSHDPARPTPVDYAAMPGKGSKRYGYEVTSTCIPLTGEDGSFMTGSLVEVTGGKTSSDE